MINNFIKHGINPNNIDILVAWNPNDLTTSVQANVDAWEKLKAHYSSVRFFFYQDTREQPIHYISSVRPNILKQHFQAYPELENEAIFYHDCDIAFTKPIGKWITDEMINDDNWYGSDCRWYISHSYIKSKGEDILKAMCSLMQIDESIIEENPLIIKLIMEKQAEQISAVYFELEASNEVSNEVSNEANLKNMLVTFLSTLNLC